jgi:hypothetical protein
LLLAGCGDDDSGSSTANDLETADEAIAAVELSLRDDGFTVAADAGNDLVFEPEERRAFDEALPGDADFPGDGERPERGVERGEIVPAGGVYERVGAAAGFRRGARRPRPGPRTAQSASIAASMSCGSAQASISSASRWPT